MRKTLPLKSLLQKVQKKELLQLSELLEWSVTDKRSPKNILAEKAVMGIRNLGSTSLGNIFRHGDPISYRELLDELYNKFSPTLPGRRSIQNIEAAIAFQLFEELLQNIKKLPRKIQQELKKGFNKAGYDTPHKLLDLISSDSDNIWDIILGAGVGGGLLGVMLLVNPILFAGAAVLTVIAGALGLGTDLVRARVVIFNIFILRQKYDPVAKYRGNSKSKKSIQSNLFKIALIGRVSSGKSATINAIMGAKASLVSPIPGSTIDIKGFNVSEKLILYDTPGLEDSRNPKYSEQAVMFAKEADVVLFIVNAQQVTDVQKNVFIEVKAWKVPYLVILNKLDTIRGDHETFSEQIRKKLGCEKRLFLSGSLNPKKIDEWDTAGQILMKINGIVKAKQNQINLNREILKIMRSGLEGLGDLNDPVERQKLAGVMNRFGIGQN